MIYNSKCIKYLTKKGKYIETKFRLMFAMNQKEGLEELD